MPPPSCSGGTRLPSALRFPQETAPLLWPFLTHVLGLQLGDGSALGAPPVLGKEHPFTLRQCQPSLLASRADGGCENEASLGPRSGFTSAPSHPRRTPQTGPCGPWEAQIGLAHPGQPHPRDTHPPHPHPLPRTQEPHFSSSLSSSSPPRLCCGRLLPGPGCGLMSGPGPCTAGPYAPPPPPLLLSHGCP